MVGKFFEKLYRVYGIMIVILYFLLPILAWGVWGLLIGVVEFFAFGYMEALFDISDKYGLAVLSAVSSVALFQALNIFFTFTSMTVPYGMVFIYITVIIVMYWTPKAP